MRKYIVVAVGCVALVLGTGKFAVSSGTDVMLGQITPTPTPGFVPWYYPSPSPWPSPVFSANAAVGNAFGAANFYNTGTSPYATVSPGTELLDTGRCFFICYGAQGNASHHLLAFGNDVSADAFTSIGAPDDCQAPMLMHCPGGVQDQVLSITQDGSGSPNGGYFVALDSAADWGVYDISSRFHTGRK